MSKNKKNSSTNTGKKKKKSIWIKLIWLAFLGPIIGLAVSLLLVWLFADLPSIEDLENPKSNLASQIITEDEKVIGEYYLQNRTHVAYYELSSNLVNALHATEDERFHKHSGIDAYALGRAIFFMGKRGGGSTLTQQLALNLYSKRAGNIRERIIQKLGEWIISARLEKRYTKEEIMTMYFNKVDFLNQGVGISSASKVYFSKSAKDLNIQEAAMLVGLVKNPNKYNPKRNPENAIKRREVVLKQMVKNDFLTQEQYDSIRVLPLGLNLTSVDHKDGIAPYFRESLRAQLNKMMKEKNADGNFKYENKETGKAYNIRKDGLKIYTTINYKMQQYAEWAVQEHLGKELQRDLERKMKKYENAPFVYRNYEKEKVKKIKQIMESAKKQSMLYKKMTGNTCGVCERPGTKKKGGVYICNFNHNHKTPIYTEKQIDSAFNTPIKTQVFDWTAKGYEKDTLISPIGKIRYLKRFLRAGMMSMDPKTGFIKAWVGGPNFKYFQYDMVRTGRRQVGSTFKPFVYATAIDAGVTSPCENILNIEHCCPIPNNPDAAPWCPKNAGIKMDGSNTPVKFGLAASMNNITAAVMKKIGPKRVRDNVIKMGIDGKYVNEYPSIALGALDLSVYEMVGAMSTFVNEGVFIKPILITRIEDKNGAIIYQAMPKTTQVFNANISYTMIRMMKGVVDGVQHPTMKNRHKRTLIGGTSMRLRSSKKYRKYAGLRNSIAGKTGTTQNNTDGWFIGLTPRLVSGVWVGGEDQGVRFKQTHFGQGANMALPIWGYYMNKVYADSTLGITKDDFDVPTNWIDDYSKCSEQETNEEINYNDFTDSGH